MYSTNFTRHARRQRWNEDCLRQEAQKNWQTRVLENGQKRAPAFAALCARNGVRTDPPEHFLQLGTRSQLFLMYRVPA